MNAVAAAVTNDEARRFGRLASMGITVPEQLLLHLPKAYKDYSNLTDKIELPFMDGDLACIRVVADSRPNIAGVAPPRLSLYVTDGNVRAKLTVFGNYFQWKGIEKEDVIFVRCKVTQWNDELQLEQPELIPPQHVGRVAPVYRGKKNVVAHETVAEYIGEYLETHLEYAAEYARRHFDGMDDKRLFEMAGVENFSSLTELLLSVHRPDTLETAGRALEAVKRLSAYDVVYQGKKRQSKRPESRSVIATRQKHVDELVSRLPYKLTEHQATAMSEIMRDLASPYCMYRLLSGDVGYGKATVIQITAAAVQAVGGKVAIMTSNQLLVRQLENEFRQHWPKVPVVSVLGNVKHLDLTNNPIVIGTTAILSRLKKAKWAPNYLVVDEQEKFSRAQREELAEAHTNILEATATCIPRTAALVSHGGMEVSVLNQSPVKKKIHTRIVSASERRRLMEHLKKVMDTGGQIAVIYPLVNKKKVEEEEEGVQKEQQKSPRTDTEGMFEVWDKQFPGQVGMLHGKMKDEDKGRIIEQMKAKEFNILVSSSIIERGITVPSLKAVVVVGADKYGASQLHQMRGRLARLGGTGYFFLYLPNDVDEDAMERLYLLEQCEDGFTLAERDMEMRGFGDLSEDGDAQHGVSRSGVFSGVKLMPIDIKLALEKAA